MTDPNTESGPFAQSLEGDKDARMWAMFCHLAALIGYTILPGIGLIVGPLIVWLIKREQSAFVAEQGKEAVNFQITMLIYHVVSSILISVFCIGFVLISLVALTDIILCVVAAIKANDGYHYRYPPYLVIRFIK